MGSKVVYCFGAGPPSFFVSILSFLVETPGALSKGDIILFSKINFLASVRHLWEDRGSSPFPEFKIQIRRTAIIGGDIACLT
jgi:hypothetical protein